MTRAAAIVISFLVLAACEQQQQQRAPDPRQSSNPDRYARDRELCRAQVDDYMRSRRNAEDSRSDVFSDDQDRMGRGQVSRQMSAYGDTRTYDKMMGSCMEARGWPQPKQEWWQRLGTPHAI
jgi:hypothetical protein